MADRIENFPSQDELEKELSDYLTKKYGCRIKVVSPVMVPKPDEPPRDDGQEGTRGIDNIRFDMKPEELLAYLDQYVIKQDDAEAILATKICTHYNRIKFQKRVERGRANQTVGRIKNNIILIGPTGVGKTYLIKLIAQKIGVPLVKGDANVATGRFDAYIESGISLWDIAAGGLIVECAGGKFWCEPISGHHRYCMVGSNGLIHRRLPISR